MDCPFNQSETCAFIPGYSTRDVVGHLSGCPLSRRASGVSVVLDRLAGSPAPPQVGDRRRSWSGTTWTAQGVHPGAISGWVRAQSQGGACRNFTFEQWAEMTLLP